MSTSTYSNVPEQPSVVTEVDRRFDTAPSHRRVSWQALLAGIFLAVAVQLLLSTLGLGVGLGLVSPNTGSTPDASSFGIGAGVWWFVSNLIALAIGGFAAARLAGVTTRLDGVLHGLVTWSVVTLFTLWLLTTAIGGLLGGAFSGIASVLSSAGAGMKSVAPQVAQSTGATPDIQSYLQPAPADPASMSPPQAQKEITSELATYAAGGSGAAPAKDRIIAIMAAQMKVSHDVAAKRFVELQARATQTKDQAVQTAKNAASSGAGAASTGAFGAFGVLLLDALAAAIGGSLAVQRRRLVADRVVRRSDGRADTVAR
ncbi:MAG: hypothetical protein M3Y41_17250 [Pseudomonadota bacterium]|nr:hypothetical protein [Pseudomonadota bacterium]